MSNKTYCRDLTAYFIVWYLTAKRQQLRESPFNNANGPYQLKFGNPSMEVLPEKVKFQQFNEVKQLRWEKLSH